MTFYQSPSHLKSAVCSIAGSVLKMMSCGWKGPEKLQVIKFLAVIS